MTLRHHLRKEEKSIPTALPFLQEEVPVTLSDWPAGLTGAAAGVPGRFEQHILIGYMTKTVQTKCSSDFSHLLCLLSKKPACALYFVVENTKGLASSSPFEP